MKIQEPPKDFRLTKRDEDKHVGHVTLLKHTAPQHEGRRHGSNLSGPCVLMTATFHRVSQMNLVPSLLPMRIHKELKLIWFQKEPSSILVVDRACMFTHSWLLHPYFWWAHMSAFHTGTFFWGGRLTSCTFPVTYWKYQEEFTFATLRSAKKYDTSWTGPSFGAYIEFSGYGKVQANEENIPVAILCVCV